MIPWDKVEVKDYNSAVPHVDNFFIDGIAQKWYNIYTGNIYPHLNFDKDIKLSVEISLNSKNNFKN